MSNNDAVNEYLNGAKKFFPFLEFGAYTSGFGNEFYFYENQQALKNSFYSPNDQQEFIHYTSLDTLFNIINHRQIRFYNLHNLNDKQELIYTAKQVGFEITAKQIEQFKNCYFIHSMCKYDYSNQDDFNLWRLYGNDGNGVGIVYKISNTSQPWLAFFLGKVLYNNKRALHQVKEFLEYHKNFVANNNIMTNTPMFIILLLLFHKNKIWSIEKEYRLITSIDFDKYTLEPTLSAFSNIFFSEHISHTISRGKQTAYIPVPIAPINETVFKPYSIMSEDEKKSINTALPNIEITKVILGYR